MLSNNILSCNNTLSNQTLSNTILSHRIFTDKIVLNKTSSNEMLTEHFFGQCFVKHDVGNQCFGKQDCVQEDIVKRFCAKRDCVKQDVGNKMLSNMIWFNTFLVMMTLSNTILTKKTVWYNVFYMWSAKLKVAVIWRVLFKSHWKKDSRSMIGSDKLKGSSCKTHALQDLTERNLTDNTYWKNNWKWQAKGSSPKKRAL